jgi:hypothetical protein
MWPTPISAAQHLSKRHPASHICFEIGTRAIGSGGYPGEAIPGNGMGVAS